MPVKGWKKWLIIPGIDGYEASRGGLIRHSEKKKLIKAHFNEAGYLRVNIIQGGKQKRFFVHTLIARTFVKNPNGLPEVNHKSGNKKNNRASNLEWRTRSYNVLHSYEKSLKKQTISAKKTSKYPGVFYSSEREKWTGMFIVNKKRYYIPKFDTEEQANTALKKKRKQILTTNNHLF